MTEFKGTKGPWYVVDGSIDGIGDCVSISEIKENQIYRPLVCVISRDLDLRDEDIPNALLISKAPEMLEMLERTVEFFDEGGSTYSTVAKFLNEIKELIKEATTL